jgi:glycosyltransferase involved in cell wall biosynthesis
VCPPDRKVLLAVGRLEAVKNYGVLVSVFGQLAARHPDWDLVILGEGPQRAALEAAIQAGPAAARIHLPGIAGNVGEWYVRAQLYVMSSHSEGFPNSLAEALVHGLPAVSFDCDTGPRDIVRHGIDGLLVPPGDAEALGRALNCLMEDPELRGDFAARAHEARERFSLERITGMWESLFREVAGARLPCRDPDTRPLHEGGEA